MKRIILSVIVLSFAFAVQAADTKAPQTKEKEKPSCCADKAKTSDKEKGGDSATKCCGCCKQQAAKPTGLQSPKAADTRS
jgi:hypothetical protein